ncbi:bifunctional riboflavin kinase/FMN adenylyltransferase [Prochlorococcus marinus XMU1408]|uniref:Riboflavin biosynthesis protein n=1 Tax=Prochlorococcus marinus XMU1408 TaxID=2213228 RepID=A0A318R189_PROMR|nr:bifunctional riboflavin kinase/FMN adenylyltransferase [Prochlorococcus marinus str. XMU1408]PYE01189.1 bifunctional riboflavin kinase/FMN adenylyltransferase [Prochlorococcus marinus XMU1408]
MPSKHKNCTFILIPLCAPENAKLPTALALGSFDGLHLGHKKVIKAILKEPIGVPTVVSFWPHPREVLFGESRLRLDLPSEKTFLLKPLGIEQLVLVPFNKILASKSAETFVDEILVKTLHAKHIAVGENFRFGRNREGDISTLKNIGATLGIKVSVVPILEDEHGRLSSSRIRKALSDGDLKHAKYLLNRPYTFRGIVERGKGLGKKIGWPTANLKIDGRKFLPSFGVYAAWASIANKKERYAAVMNLGPQPTIDPNSSSAVEVHLLSKEINLLKKELIIEPIQRIRAQQKFESVEALSKQINLDAQLAKNILATYV